VKKRRGQKGRRAFARLKPENRAFLEKRQGQKLFTDVDGAAEELRARGEEVSRSAVGRMNQWLQEEAGEIKRDQAGFQAVLNALGEGIHDAGLVMTALLYRRAHRAMQEIDMDALDFESLSNEEKIKLLFIALPAAQEKIARSAIALEASKDKQEARAARAHLADEISQDAKQAGLSDESAELIRKKILGVK
jgi:hypothetical protein